MEREKKRRPPSIPKLRGILGLKGELVKKHSDEVDQMLSESHQKVGERKERKQRRLRRDNRRLSLQSEENGHTERTFVSKYNFRALFTEDKINEEDELFSVDPSLSQREINEEREEKELESELVLKRLKSKIFKNIKDEKIKAKKKRIEAKKMDKRWKSERRFIPATLTARKKKKNSLLRRKSEAEFTTTRHRKKDTRDPFDFKLMRIPEEIPHYTKKNEMMESKPVQLTPQRKFYGVYDSEFRSVRKQRIENWIFSTSFEVSKLENQPGEEEGAGGDGEDDLLDKFLDLLFTSTD